MSRWKLRGVPADLAERYVAEGLWTGDSLGRLVERGLGQSASAPFKVRSQIKPWDGTFADVDRAARSLAGSLRKQGVGVGDVVVLQLPNWVEAGIAYWATAYLGAAVVPIVHFYGPKEVDYILRATQPDAVITADRFGAANFLETYESLLPSHGSPPWFVVPSSDETTLPSAARPLADLLDGDPVSGAAEVDPDSPAVIAFTSGTTKDPKGVIHSHRTIGCEARHLCHMIPEIGPPQITAAPVGHFIGMVNAFLTPLIRTQPVCLVDVFDPGRILKLMLDEQLMMAGGATYFLISLLDHPDFTDAHRALLPYAGLGGSTVPASVTERAEAMGIQCYRSYGSTEHPSITGATLADPKLKRNRTDGHVLPGVEIRLSDDGEIYSRGPELCLGYTDPALTAAAFDADGWYRTGDVGVLDDDGYLSITDRVSDIIIRGGENISAQEVEDVLLRMGSIAEVSVVGVPDDRFGERAAAVVRPREGQPAPSLSDMQAHLADAGLAKQKWPEFVYEVADLPRTPSGKVQKFKVRQNLREMEQHRA
ncbi:MAG TPA: AMP-binding protein [Mycobacteriales bacterium]|jgi:acyl-CoA synthetase (AMP-forming)/AMP-acid ligase II|nr:AMP-binding protein [Mycobacteriales bacterium]